MKASVFLTRPQGKNETLAAMLLAAGFNVNIVPALRVFPIVDDAKPVPVPADYQLVVFVSGQAVSFYLDAIGAHDPGFSWPRYTYAATVGWASARPLYDIGLIPPDCIIHPDANTPAQDSEALWPLITPIFPSVQRALIVRGQRGREWLGARLEAQGITLTRYAMYERQPAVWDSTQQQAVQLGLSGKQPAVFLLTSSESVDAVLGHVQKLGLLAAFASSRFVLVHSRIADHLQLGLKAAGQPPASMVKICSPTDTAIFQTLQDSASPDASS